MADDANDVQDGEISLEDFMADEQESPKAESSPVEEIKPEVAKEAEAVADAPPEAEEGSDAEDTAEDKPQGKAEERKAQLQKEIDEGKESLGIDPNREIRDMVSARNAIKDAVKKANEEVYQPATEQDLVADGMSTTDAKIESMRQALEVRDYNERVVEAQLTLSSESERVLNEFAWANPESPDYDKEIAEDASALLEQNLIIDENTGQIIGSHVSPYQLYKTLNRAAGVSSTKGQLKGQKDTEQMLASADSGASVAPPAKKTDPLAELWSEDL